MKNKPKLEFQPKNSSRIKLCRGDYDNSPCLWSEPTALIYLPQNSELFEIRIHVLQRYGSNPSFRNAVLNSKFSS